MPPLFDSARAQRVLDELAARVPELANKHDSHAIIAAAAGNSPYLGGLILKEPGLVSEFLAGPQTHVERLTGDVLAVADAESVPLAQREMRIAKRRVALAIALADICGVFTLQQCMEQLTRFADACVKAALRFQIRTEMRIAGIHGKIGENTCGLVILAMGKMGAFELNYSSDVDLVVFFDPEHFAFARNGDKHFAAVEMVKGIVKLLAEITSEGYVFRVDLRLRPDAGSTQVAISTPAAEAYYEAMGQNWERAAWIKARQCAGDRETGALLLKRMEPFVWRRHLDYAAIQDIHSIKRQIHSRSGHDRIAVAGHNIKLGRGGIREIEFFVQTQQLILGGRDISLREPSTLGALAALRARGHISPQAEHELAEAYCFLRFLEHRLQMIDDQQTHVLPKSPDEIDHVARFAGFDDTNAFEEKLRRELTNVQSHYARLFETEESLSLRTGSLVFTGVEEDPETLATLTRMGFANAAAVSAAIRGWHHGRIRATRSARARELLTRLMPALLKSLSRTADPASAFVHFDQFLSGLSSGVQFFSMLAANHRLLDLLAEIAGSAPKLAGYLGRNPGVLDVLIDPGFLTQLPSTEELETAFTNAAGRAPQYESALDGARRFAKEEMFRVGARVIFGIGSISDAGPAYCAIAETVIRGLLPVVEQEIVNTHGRLPGAALAVVAQGKLGGREMTATSDLDLVFIYSHDPGAVQSDGERSLPASTWFARLAQRYIAALTALTAEGRLYEVDMRLRPSGNQGPVAVHFDTFANYHREHSWTWERMALTRARVIAGPDSLGARITFAISELLARSCEISRVKSDAFEMRQKLAAQFPARTPWDLKFAAGGLVDIEFAVQALQLCHAEADGGLRDQNTIAAAENLMEAGVLAPADAQVLIAAARLQQDLTQVLRIAVDGEFHPDTATPGLKSLLARVAGVPEFSEMESLLHERQAAARDVFQRVITSAVS